ncbi:UNVERIFIED_CONTAM: hypothetical protein Scaly_0930500 [Sesamum calycinum]|uniref:Uncharacterized protein n=1 Tax=Sesamum calycinum TaxID=2727403 RepID=A0AAW2QXQ8_9LAMI
MDSAKQDKVRKFEEFVDRRLKPDLVHAIAQRSDLRRNIENLEKNSVTSLRTLVNLGSEVYMQADVQIEEYTRLIASIKAQIKMMVCKFVDNRFIGGLQVEWYLANVVVVVESQWGLAPLKRSSYLVKGMRRVAFSMIMLFGVLLGLLAMLCSSLVPDVGGIREGWVSWAFIFQTVVYTGFMTILMLYSIAANAMLFMYCKALHGELAFEIAEEFARSMSACLLMMGRFLMLFMWSNCRMSLRLAA